MTLDRDRLVALCRAVDDADEPEYLALWDEMIATAKVDPLEVERLAAEFAAAGADPDIALYCARSIESTRVSPELVARMEVVRRERPHHVVAAAELSALSDAVRPDPQLAFDLALDELRRVERGDALWATDFAELFGVLRAIHPHWLDALIDLVPWAGSATGAWRLGLDRPGPRDDQAPERLVRRSSPRSPGPADRVSAGRALRR